MKSKIELIEKIEGLTRENSKLRRENSIFKERILSKGPRLENTADYSLFSLHLCNRDEKINKRMLDSMRLNGFSPAGAIHVVEENGRLVIIQGHHRFLAAQKLGLPIWYIATDFQGSTYDLEGSSSSAWRVDDFCYAYVGEGRREYVRLDNFVKTHRIPLTAAAAICCGKGNQGMTNDQMKTGDYVATDLDHAEKVVSVLDICIEERIKFAKSYGFVMAVSSILKIPEISIKKLITRIRKDPGSIEKRGTRSDYLKEFDNLYNKGAKTKGVHIMRRVREVAAENNPRRSKN